MRAALQARTGAILPQSLDVLLRFFDTRVLSRLLTALSPGQRDAFLSVAAVWAFPDRWGQLLVERALGVADSDTGPLRLDVRQEAQLIDAGDADAMVDTLLGQQDASLARLLPPEQYEMVNAALTRAQALGIHRRDEQVAFCSLYAELGADFPEQTPWTRWWADVRSGKKTFTEIVALAAGSEAA